MILRFYFYSFLKYFSAKFEYRDAIRRSIALVGFSVLAMFNILFIFLRACDVIDLYRSNRIALVLSSILIFVFLYFLLVSNGKDQLILEEFAGGELDTDSNRKMCYVCFLVMFLMPFMLGLLLDN